MPSGPSPRPPGGPVRSVTELQCGPRATALPHRGRWRTIHSRSGRNANAGSNGPVWRMVHIARAARSRVTAIDRHRVHDAPRRSGALGSGVPGSSGVHDAPEPPTPGCRGASCTRGPTGRARPVPRTPREARPIALPSQLAGAIRAGARPSPATNAARGCRHPSGLPRVKRDPHPTRKPTQRGRPEGCRHPRSGAIVTKEVERRAPARGGSTRSGRQPAFFMSFPMEETES